MNLTFLLAGSASTNPVLLVVLAVGLIIAWKTAGFIGLDYVLLPLLGTPWRRTTDGDPLTRGTPPHTAPT